VSSIKRIVLDVLKPHQPQGIDFAKTLAELSVGYQVIYAVDEVDEKTESVIIEIKGDNIDLDPIKDAIHAMGGSLHSVDEIEIHNSL